MLNIQNVVFGGARGVLASVSPDVTQRGGGSLWLSQGDVAGPGAELGMHLGLF